MVFDLDTMKDDFLAVLNVLPDAETVVVLPDDGTPREIKAVIDREAVRQLDGLSGVAGPVFTIEIANHPTLGIATDELDTTWHIEFPTRIGQAPTRRKIGQLVTHDAARLVLEVM